MQRTEGPSLAAINGKIIKCDTDNVVATITLPAGASTSAKQDTGNSSLSSINGKVTACNTGAVTISSSALPTDAATSANQTTGNSSLSTIAGTVTTSRIAVNPISGQAGVAVGVAAVDALTQRTVEANVHWVRTGGERITCNAASQDTTIPALTVLVRIAAEAGDIRYDIGVAASATSPGFLSENTVEWLKLATGDDLNVYGVVGAYANLLYFNRA